MTLNDFQEFFFRSSVMDLALAMVFGRTFADLIESLVKNIFLPLFSSLIGNINIGDLSLKLGRNIDIKYGLVLNVAIYFILSMSILYIFFIQPFNSYVKENEKKLKQKQEEEDNKIKQEKEEKNKLRETLKNRWKLNLINI